MITKSVLPLSSVVLGKMPTGAMLKGIKED
jgi:hypothetical protein